MWNEQAKRMWTPMDKQRHRDSWIIKQSYSGRWDNRGSGQVKDVNVDEGNDKTNSCHARVDGITTARNIATDAKGGEIFVKNGVFVSGVVNMVVTTQERYRFYLTFLGTYLWRYFNGNACFIGTSETLTTSSRIKRTSNFLAHAYF